VVVLLAGLLTHAFGMWDKHRLEIRTGGDRGPWVLALYWICWLMLAGLVVYVWLHS
jgi:hypothetical protein